jgi:hypothetical protein
MRLVLALILVMSLGLAACDDGSESVGEQSVLEGVVVEIDSPSFGEVTSFTLKEGDTTHEIYIAEDVDYSFPLGHLQEHVQSADPVVVDTQERDGKLYALFIEDA